MYSEYDSTHKIIHNPGFNYAEILYKKLHGVRSHFVQKTPDILPNTKGCQECEGRKLPWVAIRMCLIMCCTGNVNACDSSREDM